MRVERRKDFVDHVRVIVVDAQEVFSSAVVTVLTSIRGDVHG